ncbi:MAG: hypothetical protein NC338_06795 [Firmicutes bacterium]|nr:hypothetical protein [Bacillota bacterium]MCM1401665.1 hypothetical protein [Bacteroides sp.]MCM1477558.1 hypothetical protein [Bacteroides sp.]
MKRHVLTLAALLIASFVATPTLDAQSRPGRRGGSGSHNSGMTHSRPAHGSHQNGSRPGNGNSRPGNGNSRPGNGNVRPGKPSDNHKPSPGHHQPSRPQKPGVGNQQPPRPGFGHQRPSRPSHQPARPGFRPAHPHHGFGYRHPSRPPMMRPTARPGRPPMRPWSRPVPPPNWRPVYSGSLLGNILGLTFGVALGTALDNLYSGGYAIDGYMNNEVYLTGVNQFNYYWPDATLYFGNGGGLVRSQFFNPTRGYDVTRYYDLYANLCAIYGNPAMQNSSGTNLSATWFGGGGDYITLQYSPMASGGYNYFTILTIGR